MGAVAPFHWMAVTPAMLSLPLAIAAIGCSGPVTPTEPPSFVATAYLTATGDAGALSVEVRTSPQPPQRGTIAVELAARDATDGGPRDGLTLDVSPFMPAHGHGTSVRPTVTAQGSGRYLVTNVDLDMPGQWEVRTTFSGPVNDYVAPSFDIP